MGHCGLQPRESRDGAKSWSRSGVYRRHPIPTSSGPESFLRECEFAFALETAWPAEASDTSKLPEKVRQYGLTGLLGFGKRLKG
jgi:hypothetical protein